MDKLKTGFLVVLVGMIVIGAIATYVGADSAFCKYHNGGSSIGSYCDAYTDCGDGYCINNIACDDWMYNQYITFCIYRETFYYFGFNC